MEGKVSGVAVKDADSGQTEAVAARTATQ